MKNILITGASGFIGSFLVEEALKRNYNVIASIRSTSSRAHLSDPRINFCELTLSDPGKLRQQLTELKSKYGKLHYVIHNAGITKANKKEDYHKINFGFTKNFAEALIAAGEVPDKFIYISSLAAQGPGDRKTIVPVKHTDEPRPVTSYGKSKLESEQFIRSLNDFPYVIIRPVPVYGPREKDIFIFFKLINRYFEPYIGSTKQFLTFIYVHDLVKAIFLSMESEKKNKIYFVTDGKVYDTRMLGNFIRKYLKKKTFKVTLPTAFVRALAWSLDKSFGMFGKSPALNLEKMNELEEVNWVCDTSDLQKELGFAPEYDLDRGIAETVKWYKENKWL